MKKNEKKTRKENVKKSIYFIYSEREEVFEKDENEDERFAESKVDYRPVGIQLAEPSGYRWNKEEVDFNLIPGERYFCVVVRYSDGGTFGVTRGQGYLEGIYETASAAIETKQQISHDIYDRKRWKPWCGHFARLEDVEIHSFILNGKNDLSGDIIYH